METRSCRILKDFEITVLDDVYLLIPFIKKL